MSGPARREATTIGPGLVGWRSGPRHAGTVVLLVHGAMDRSASFTRLARRLAEAADPDGPEVSVVAYDRRGYDHSLALGPGTIDQHARDLAAVVDDLAPSRVVVLGHSLGGTVAVRAVDRGLDPFAVAVFESPLPQLPSYRNDLAAAALEAATSGGPPAAAERFSRAVLGDRAWERLRPEVRSARLAEGAALCAELGSLADLPELTWPPARPAAVGRGELSGDHYRDTAAESAQLLGGGGVTVLAGAGHGAHLSHPDGCAAWLRGLLDPA